MAYIGLREINKDNKSEDQDQLKPWQRYQVVQAAWSPIVSAVVFADAQKALEEGRIVENQRLSTAQTM